MNNSKNIIYIFGFGAFGSAITYALNGNADNFIYISDPNIKNSDEISNVLNSSVRINLDYSRIKILDNDNFVEYSYIFLAIPSKSINIWVSEYINKIPKTVKIINLSKGFNVDGGLIFSFLVEHFPFNNILSIKGPSFAEEIKRGYPTLLTVSHNTADYHILDQVKSIFNDSNILLEFNSDYFGVEVLSVLKNIYSIFIGIVDAKFDAVNTTFFVFTKSIKEIEVLLVMYDGNKESLLSAAGIGDFGLTSLNDMSRNRTFGLFVGKGFYDKRNKHSVLVEGVRSIELVYNKAVINNKVDKLPILNFLYGLFFEDKDIKELNNLLLSL